MENLGAYIAIGCGFGALVALASGAKPSYFTQACWIIQTMLWAAMWAKK